MDGLKFDESWDEIWKDIEAQAAAARATAEAHVAKVRERLKNNAPAVSDNQILEAMEFFIPLVMNFPRI